MTVPIENLVTNPGITIWEMLKLKVLWSPLKHNFKTLVFMPGVGRALQRRHSPVFHLHHLFLPPHFLLYTLRQTETNLSLLSQEQTMAVIWKNIYFFFICIYIHIYKSCQFVAGQWKSNICRANYYFLNHLYTIYSNLHLLHSN